MVSVCWQPWVWIKRPGTKWLCASYAQVLSTRDSVKARRLIQSPWYQRRWGHLFRFQDDQNQKTRFENDATGYRIATSTDGVATGEGGDFIVIDDPHNVKEAESDVTREDVLVWWDEVMSSRLNDPKTGVKVIIMQRVHERDLSGHVLQQGGYEHLCLPMRYEPSRLVPHHVDYTPPTVLGFTDPRHVEGQLLAPDRYGEPEVEELEASMGPYAAAGQLQQRPAPRGGGLFKRENMKVIGEIPPQAKITMRTRTWDLAATDPKKIKSTSDPDYSCGELWAIDQDKNVYCEDVTRLRASPGDVDQRIVSVAKMDGKRVTIWIEQEPGSSGKFVVDAYRTKLIGWSVNPPRPGLPDSKAPTGSKVQRAEPLAIHSEMGKMFLIRGEWNAAFIHEYETFPMGAHDDQVDPGSHAFQRLTETQPSTAELMRQRGYYGR